MTDDVKYLHKVVESHVVNGKRVTHEEFLIHGDKGFSMKFYHKDDKSKMKVHVSNKNGKYEMEIAKGDDAKEKKVLTKEELLKELKTLKLDFAIEYIKASKDLAGGKRASKKASKKTSKKASKKVYKKVSKKGSKNQMGGEALVGGKRRASKKTSKKASKKASRK